MKNTQFNSHKTRISPAKRITNSFNTGSAINKVPNTYKKINYSERKDIKEKDHPMKPPEKDLYESNLSTNTHNSKQVIQNNTQVHSGSLKRNNSHSIIGTNNTITNNIKTSNFELSDLLFNVNDDYRTLVNKNTNLRALVVQASNKLGEISGKFNEKEEEYRLEKQTILDELDKITLNYKTYAEGYKNFQKLEEQYKNLQKDYNHNYKVLTAYQDSLSVFLKDYMELYKLIVAFLGNKYTKNPLQFLFDIKELILENLSKYKGTIDFLNFRDIFDEFTEITNQNKDNKMTFYTSTPKEHSNQASFDSPEVFQSHSTSNKRSTSPLLNQNNHSKSPSRQEKSNTIKKSNKDPYNYPLKPSVPKNSSTLNPKSKSPSRETNKQKPKHQRNASVDDAVNNKNKCIDYMESHIKNYFDQLNTKNEIKELTDSINNVFEKMNNNLIVSKESINTSNISNVFEKNSNKDMLNNPINSDVKNTKIKKGNVYETDRYNSYSIANDSTYTNQIYQEINDEPTPQFPDEDKKIFGFVINDFEKSREGEISCSVGDRVEIISINRTKGYLYIINDGEKGLIPEKFVQWDE